MFLYTTNDSQRKLGKNPIYNCNKNNKIVGISVHKEERDLNTENYKTLIRKIKEHINKWKNTLCLQIEIINIVKMPI